MDNDFATGYALGADSNGGNNGGGMWGDNGWWAIILFAMIFGWGNGGFGGGFGGGGNGVQGALTRADLCQDMNFQSMENGIRGIQQGLCDGFYAQNTNLMTGLANVNTNIMQGFHGVDNAVCTLGYQTQARFNALGTQLASCCCGIERAIDGVNYNMANNTRDIIDSQNAGTRAILDYLCQEKINDLQAENQSLRLAASQQAQNNYLVNTLRPIAQPAYITCNPYTGLYGGYQYNGQGYGYNNGGCGCNSGCCGCNG